MAVIPLNSTSATAMNHLHLVIRLDYLLHAILFLPWALICIITFRPSGWREKLLLIAAGLLTAFATEGVQYFLTYRSYNINDLLANFLGVILGSIILFIIPTKKPTNLEPPT